MKTKFLLSAGVMAMVVVMGSGCLFSGGRGTDPSPAAGVSVEIRIHAAALAKSGAAKSGAAPATDSIHIRVTAPDMAAAEFGFAGASATVALSDLTAGENRRFEVRLYGQRKLLYAGEATATLYTDRKNSLVLHCLPEFSGLSASIHIPLDFPKTVAGGRLVVWNESDTLSAAPTVNGELRNFRLDRVPGDRDYAVSLALWGVAGDTLAKASKAGVHVPKGQNVALVMPLVTTFPQLQIAMTVGEPKTTSLTFHFTAGRRAPAAFGEVVFSELYPIPAAEDSGDTGEWLELFNRMSDTLDVSGCQILRDAGTSTGMVTVLPAGTVVAPARGLVVGRSAVAFADVRMLLSPLTLTNTSARLEFNCPAAGSGALRLDTLTYTTSASDAVSARIATGKVTSLKPSHLAARRAAEAWCQVPPRSATGEAGATPGTLFGSCGE
ncbi:MAG: Lamin Tail Domain [Fibrobacteria bacterium]|jgi:hypothetical protein|nr:Lamin Tail Domain [Fibrobacteria bacterium]